MNIRASNLQPLWPHTIGACRKCVYPNSHLDSSLKSPNGVFRKDYGNRNWKQLVSAVVSFAKQGTETETTYGPGRPARPPEAKIAAIFFWDVVAHQRACLLEFWIKFSTVSSTQKTCFQTQKCWKFDKFTFWELNIWQMYVSCMSWCMWCMRGGLTGRSQWR